MLSRGWPLSKSVTDQLELEGAGDACDLLMNYDRNADEWTLGKIEGLWAAADVARGLGRTGAGRIVALADSACDLTIPRLGNAVRFNELPYGGASVGTCHGTVVALLITEIAPDVEIHAYEVVKDGLPQQPALATALEAISTSAAGVVNLSLGDAQLPGDSTAQHGGVAPSVFAVGSSAPTCPSGLCTAVERIVGARAGRAVVAAAGNAGGMVYCPARSPAALSCGFQSVTRRSIRLEDGGWMDIAERGPPSYPQSAIVAFVLRQPLEAVGSSFATPLLAGAIALMDNPEELRAFMAAYDTGGVAQFMIQSEVNGTPTDTDASDALAMFNRAIEILPHRHQIESRTPTACFECSVFAESIYVDMGRHYFGFGEVGIAEGWLRLALNLCPWSVDAAANLGAVLTARAEGNRDVLLEARRLYDKALTARSESRTFLEAIRAIDESLA